MTTSHRFYLTDDKSKFIHYEIIKNVVPKTTLFIHGNISSNRWWYPLVEIIKNDRLEAAADIILAEIRGCGQSSDVDNLEVISIDSLSAEFERLISALALKDFNVVGHSTGGSIAFSMLTKVANKEGRAVLIDPVGARGRVFEVPMIRAFEKMKTDIGVVRDVMRVTVRSPHLDPIFFEDVVVSDAFRAARVMGIKIAQAFSRFYCVDKLGQIQSSVLVLHGEEDQVLPLSDSRELAQLIPTARFEVLRGLGHCPNLEDPQQLWNHMKSFLFLK